MNSGGASHVRSECGIRSHGLGILPPLPCLLIGGIVTSPSATTDLVPLRAWRMRTLWSGILIHFLVALPGLLPDLFVFLLNIALFWIRLIRVFLFKVTITFDLRGRMCLMLVWGTETSTHVTLVISTEVRWPPNYSNSSLYMSGEISVSKTNKTTRKKLVPRYSSGPEGINNSATVLLHVPLFTLKTFKGCVFYFLENIFLFSVLNLKQHYN